MCTLTTEQQKGNQSTEKQNFSFRGEGAGCKPNFASFIAKHIKKNRRCLYRYPPNLSKSPRDRIDTGDIDTVDTWNIDCACMIGGMLTDADMAEHTDSVEHGACMVRTLNDHTDAPFLSIYSFSRTKMFAKQQG